MFTFSIITKLHNECTITVVVREIITITICTKHAIANFARSGTCIQVFHSSYLKQITGEEHQVQ